MNKTEEFYRQILKEKVVNVEDLKDISKNIFGNKEEYYYRKYIYKLKKEGKIGKIRKGLYHAIPLDKLEEDFEADRYLVANKLEKPLAYHTALELHGAAHSAFTKIFVLVTRSNRFRGFKFQGVGYEPVVNEYDVGHITSIEYRDTKIDVTGPERTFVDCIHRTNLCGGWEECLKSLANLRRISINRIKDVLNAYDNKTLELKCGYILELLSDNSPYYEHVKKEDLNPLKPGHNWKPVYIDRSVKSSLIEEWGLYVPDHLEELLRGV